MIKIGRSVAYKLQNITLITFFFILANYNTIFAQTCSGTANIPKNGTITVNGVQITSTSTGYVDYFPTALTSCVNATTSPGSLHVGYNPNSATLPALWQVNLTFNIPVNNLVIVINAAGEIANENFIFNSNGGAVSISSSSSCYSTISGNTISSGLGAPSGSGGGGGGIFKISAASSFTSLTISGNGGSNGSLMAICQATIVPACTVGSMVPPVKNLTNVCPVTTVNLATAHTGTTPTGANLQWFNNSSHTGTPLTAAQIAAAPAGTYYAFYYESTPNCYSIASAPVVVSINTLDSDGDGVSDNCDLDDDNDGILDTNEGYCQSQSTYTMNMAATFASAVSAFNANGSTFNLVYTLTSGTAAQGLGNTFNIPFTYSDFNNQVSVQNHTWEGINQLFPSTIDIRPVTSTLYLSLPINNTNTENISAAPPGTYDGQFRYLLNNGRIDKLGVYTTTLGNIPSTGALSTLSSYTPVNLRSNFNVTKLDNVSFYNGYYSKMQVQTVLETDFFASTADFATTYGQTYIWDYTAMNDGSRSLAPNDGNRGLIEIVQNTITFCNHRDTDVDGIPDYLDLDSDNDDCVDAREGDENVTVLQLINASGTVSVGTGSGASNKNLGNNVGATAANLGVPNIVNSGGAADIGSDVGQGIGSTYDKLTNPCCNNTAAPGPPDSYAKTGVSSLKGFANGWPTNIPNGFIAIESKTNGFVITRITSTATITNPVEGMLVYDLSSSTVKLYYNSAWHSLNKDCN